MKKMLRNRNVWLLAGIAQAIIAVILISTLMDKTPDTLPEMETGEAAPLGYIRAQANGESRWIPLPTDDTDLYINIGREGDAAISNTLRLWKDGFCMDSSTCDNQDCVMQGNVTLANKNQRVLMHMVLCLPHDVVVELYSTEELNEMLAAAQQQ